MYGEDEKSCLIGSSLVTKNKISYKTKIKRVLDKLQKAIFESEITRSPLGARVAALVWKTWPALFGTAKHLHICPALWYCQGSTGLTQFYLWTDQNSSKEKRCDKVFLGMRHTLPFGREVPSFGRDSHYLALPAFSARN